MTRFAQERIKDVWDELLINFHEHWKETEAYRHGQPFNPDKSRYIQYEDLGYFLLFTVRDEGKLVGNCTMYVLPSMHTQELVATEDTWYLLPDYRKSGIGVRLYKYVEKKLESLGVVEITMTAKESNKSGKIMEGLGFEKVASEYAKQLRV